MAFPGSNLLEDAFDLIDPIQIQYYKFNARAPNGVGQYVTTYSSGVPIMASVQAVARTLYAMYGLDLQKIYIMVYTSQDTQDLEREKSGDVFITPDNKVWKLESESDWYGEDGGFYGIPGWTGSLAVKIPRPANLPAD